MFNSSLTFLVAFTVNVRWIYFFVKLQLRYTLYCNVFGKNGNSTTYMRKTKCPFLSASYCKFEEKL